MGDDATARTADALAVALESAFGRRLLEALAEAALELSPQLPEGRIEVRMAGRDPELVFIGDVPTAPATVDEAPSARITLRLPERLKACLEAAAAARGASLNTWLVHTLSRAVEPPPRATGGRHRLTGYGRN